MPSDPRQLLQDHIDGTLPPEREGELQDLLRDSADARRYVAEHRRLWELLGEVEAREARASPAFREQTRRRVQEARAHLRTSTWTRALAASLLVAAVALVWFSWERPGQPHPDDREVVRYLHVLQDYELLDEYAWELDLRGELDVLEAFDGELEGEG